MRGVEDAKDDELCSGDDQSVVGCDPVDIGGMRGTPRVLCLGMDILERYTPDRSGRNSDRAGYGGCRRRDYPRRSERLRATALTFPSSPLRIWGNASQRSKNSGDLPLNWISSRLDMAISGCVFAETGFVVASIWAERRSKKDDSWL